MKPRKQRQQLIYDYLREKNTPQSAYDILDAFRDHGIRAPVQVYRELKKLLECGLIHKVESLNAYIACKHEHRSGQSVVAICNDCGSVQEMSVSVFSDHFQSLSDWEEFTPQEMNIEVKGRCSDCD